MADRTSKVIHKTRPRAGRDSFVVKNSTTIYEGSLVQVDANGFLEGWDQGGALVGILIGGDTTDAGAITGDTSASIPPEGRVDTSGVILMHVPVTGAAQAYVGDLVYCTTDNPAADLTRTDPGVGAEPVGWMVRYRSASDCDVQLFTPAEFKAGIAGTTWTS